MSLQGFGRTEFIPALTQHAKALIVVSHGLGDNCYGWTWFPQGMRRLSSKFNDVAFLFPTAKTVPVTLQAGIPTTAWYDIISLEFREINATDPKVPTGFLDSNNYIQSLVDEHTAKLKLPSHRAILGGFSQGGAMALTAGLSYPKRLGGIFAMSGYLPLNKEQAFTLYEKSGDVNKTTPVLMLHGDADRVVQLKYAKMTRDVLEEKGYDVSLEVFSQVPHTIDERGLDSLSKYLLEQINGMDQVDEKASGAEVEEKAS